MGFLAENFMKTIIQLERAIKNIDYYVSQFSRNVKNNLLFVHPVLSGNGFYHQLLHYLDLRYEETQTAITGIFRYEEIKNYKHIPDELFLTNLELNWANKVVFPFQIKSLLSHFNQIRTYGNADIFYCIDFNFYELPTGHKYKKYFNKKVIDIIEENIINSDVVFVYNAELKKYIENRFDSYLKEGGKYHKKDINIDVRFMPFFADTVLTLENIDYESETICVANNYVDNITSENNTQNTEKDDIKKDIEKAYEKQKSKHMKHKRKKHKTVIS